MHTLNSKQDLRNFKNELVRFIKSELVGSGTVVTKNGKLWLRFPVALAGEVFEDKSFRQIRYALEVLVDTGILMESKIDKNQFDQASWYALVDQPEHLV